MKIKVILIIIFCLTLIRSNTLARNKKSEISLAFGLSPLLYPNIIEESYKPGLTARVGLGYYLSSQLVIGGRVAYNSFSLIKGNFSGNIEGATLSIIEILGEGKYYLKPKYSERRAIYYVLGGFGLSWTKFSGGKSGFSGEPLEKFSSTTKFSYMGTLGLGSKFKINSKFSLFIEPRVNILFINGKDIIHTSFKENEIFYASFTIGFLF